MVNISLQASKLCRCVKRMMRKFSTNSNQSIDVNLYLYLDRPFANLFVCLRTNERRCAFEELYKLQRTLVVALPINVAFDSVIYSFEITINDALLLEIVQLKIQLDRSS